MGIWGQRIDEEFKSTRPTVTANNDIALAEILETRQSHPQLSPHPELPDDTRLWAALQQASGGIWAGCVYDVERIIEVLNAGMQVLQE